MLHPGHVHIGSIIRTPGLQGEMLIELDVDKPSRYARIEHFFVDVHGSLVPFFIEKIKLSGRQLLVKTEGISNPEDASVYLKRDVFVPVDMLPELGDDSFYYHEVNGFALVDDERGEIGVVEEVREYPHQAIIHVKCGAKEALIPLIKGVLQRVDRKEKKLFVKSPEGLLSIYLDESSDDEETDI